MRQRRPSRREIRFCPAASWWRVNSSRAFGRPPESPSTLVIRRRFPSSRPGLRNFPWELRQWRRIYVSDIHMYDERDIRTRISWFCRIEIFRENSLLQLSAFYGTSWHYKRIEDKRKILLPNPTRILFYRICRALSNFNMIMLERDRVVRKLVFRGLIPISLNSPWKRIEARHTCVAAAS